MGSPHLFRSDNGSNFVGAERELNLIQDGTFQGCSRMGGKKGLNFLRLLASAFHLQLCLHSALTLHFHALILQSYRNHVKEISGSFKDPARVDLAVLKKIVNF